jgi:hypothetical protein
MTHNHPAIETKSDPAGYAALADSFDEFMSTFSEFREGTTSGCARSSSARAPIR